MEVASAEARLSASVSVRLSHLIFRPGAPLLRFRSAGAPQGPGKVGVQAPPRPLARPAGAQGPAPAVAAAFQGSPAPLREEGGKGRGTQARGRKDGQELWGEPRCVRARERGVKGG